MKKFMWILALLTFVGTFVGVRNQDMWDLTGAAGLAEHEMMEWLNPNAALLDARAGAIGQWCLRSNSKSTIRGGGYRRHLWFRKTNSNK